MAGEIMLRVANVESEAVLETVRDVLDQLGVEYEHARSEPEDSYPQTAYFYVTEDASETVDHAVTRLSKEYGYEAEIL
jgi:hypothetical protein